jgi:hypothetical protein
MGESKSSAALSARPGAAAAAGPPPAATHHQTSKQQAVSRLYDSVGELFLRCYGLHIHIGGLSAAAPLAAASCPMPTRGQHASRLDCPSSLSLPRPRANPLTGQPRQQHTYHQGLYEDRGSRDRPPWGAAQVHMIDQLLAMGGLARAKRVRKPGDTAGMMNDRWFAVE